MLNGKNVGPYTSVSRDETRGNYRILLYGAFNAFGLIGSEYNGICVLDEKNRAVVADNICCEDSGYFGPSKAQVAAFEKMLKCNKKEFVKIVNSAPRLRYPIAPDSI